MEGLKDYQFSQTGKDMFEMEAEIVAPNLKESVKKEMLGQMRKILKEKRLGYVQFYVNFVDEIKADPATGKKRLVISRYQEG